MKAMNFFSADYGQARAKFLSACQTVGASVESIRHPATGPDGEALFMDVAMMGAPDAHVALILGSGTHGVEGFAGSGIQCGLLQEGLTSRLKTELRLIMIHAINPYGFAHLRRVNEDNIDLNRNFVDHSRPHPHNPHYDALAIAIAPKSYSFADRMAAISRLSVYGVRHGRAALKAAITGGQYSHPKGLFFGGRFEAWSNEKFRSIIERHLYDATRVAFIDFHTGLGPHGHGEAILNEQMESEAYRRAVKWWGDRVTTTKAGDSVSADLSGTIKLSISRMLPEAETTAISLEFGTVSSVTVFRAMQAENWLHHYGDKGTQRAVRIKTEMRRVFYPETDEWKTLVWNQGKKVVEQSVKGLLT